MMTFGRMHVQMSDMLIDRVNRVRIKDECFWNNDSFGGCK